MNKTRLDLDDIAVDTFDLGSDGAAERGTVEALEGMSGLPSCWVSECVSWCNDCPSDLTQCSLCTRPTIVGDTCWDTCACG